MHFCVCPNLSCTILDELPPEAQTICDVAQSKGCLTKFLHLEIQLQWRSHSLIFLQTLIHLLQEVIQIHLWKHWAHWNFTNANLLYDKWFRFFTLNSDLVHHKVSVHFSEYVWLNQDHPVMNIDRKPSMIKDQELTLHWNVHFYSIWYLHNEGSLNEDTGHMCGSGGYEWSHLWILLLFVLQNVEFAEMEQVMRHFLPLNPYTQI